MHYVDANNRRQLPTNWANFGPRLGFAYAISAKMVLRGGVGLMYPPSAATAGGAGHSRTRLVHGTGAPLIPGPNPTLAALFHQPLVPGIHQRTLRRSQCARQR